MGEDFVRGGTLRGEHFLASATVRSGKTFCCTVRGAFHQLYTS